MKLFRRHKPATEINGRRRPTDTTMAGRSQAFSYYAHDGTSGSNTGRGEAAAPERIMRAHSQNLLQNRLMMIICSLTVILIIGFMLMLGGKPKIVTLNGSGSSYFLEDSGVYQQTASKAIAQSIINDNKLTIDTNQIIRDLKQAHPEIESATVATPLFGRSPIVYIKPYAPSFILVTASNTAFLLNDTGRALVSTSQITDPGELAVPTLKDSATNNVQLGSQALPGNTIRFISVIAGGLASKKIAYDSLELPQAAGELQVHISGTPYYVKFNTEGEALEQLGTYLAAKQRLERDHTVPAEYIDVRVPDRAYYR